MKQLSTVILSTIWIFGCLNLHAQGQGNPYKGLNVPPVEILSLSKGKYVEVFDNDTLISIGTVRYNTLTGEVIELLDADSVLQHIPPIGVPSRWLSIDPLGAKYPQWSPYTGFADNPVLYVDPDGAEIIISYVQDGETKNFTYSYDKDRKLDDNSPDFLKNTIQVLYYLYVKEAMKVNIVDGDKTEEIDGEDERVDYGRTYYETDSPITTKPK